MKFIKLTLPLVLLTFLISPEVLMGQQVPMHPVSYRIFSPFIFNPAIAGSKDFSNLDLLISNYGESNSQMASGNLRLAKSGNEYFSSQSAPEFSNIGIGGYLFNDYDGLTRNYGIAGTGSYHIKLDKNALSFLSIGISAKAIFNNYHGDTDNSIPSKETFIPNIDAGLYYYNSSFYAGISATNIMGNPEEPDSLGNYSVPVSRQYYLNSGYKIILSRAKNILIEPFIIVNSNDSLSGKISEMLKPGLKIYFQNFSMGTYFNDFNKISFYTQFKYSKAYIGAYFEIPYKTAFYIDPIIAELAVGLNLSSIKSGFSRRNHW
jgi:type IX secretion system PorP/SprF family membrane protein